MNPLDLSPDWRVWAAILGAALVTYGLRAGGLLLAQRLPRAGRSRRFMDALPGALLLSLVAPGAVSGGILECAATCCVMGCVLKTRNLFLAMSLGVLLVALGRYLA